MKSLTLACLIAFVMLTCGCAVREFYPVGIYTVPCEESLVDAVRAGFNCVVIYDTGSQAIIEAEALARTSGLKLVCYPGTKPHIDGSFDSEIVDDVLASTIHSDSILAWYLYDEPEVYKLRPDLLMYFNRYVKARNPDIQTCFVVSHGRKYRDYAGCSDVAMLDWYPIPLHPLESISEHIEACREYLPKGARFWMVLQSFDWTPFSERVRSEGNGRVPTLEELRFMAFLSVAEDVDGLFFWTYRTPKDEWVITDHPRLWKDLQEVVRDIKSVYPFLLAKESGRARDVLVTSDADVGDVKWSLRKVVAGDIRSRWAGSSSAEETMRQGYYLLVVNASDVRTHVTFSQLPLQPSKLIDVLGNEVVIMAGKDIGLDLGPYEVRLLYLGI